MKKIDIANIADRTHYYSSELKCDAKWDAKYKTVVNINLKDFLLKNTLAIEITMSSVKTQTAIFRYEFAVNQHDKVLHEQESIDLRLNKLFSNEEIIKEYSALHYRTGFAFKKNMLVVETDEKGHVDRDPNYEKKDEKIEKKLVTTSLEVILISQILIIMKNLVE